MHHNERMAHPKEVRFGLGTPEGQYSTVWRVWVQGNEVYMTSRMFGRWMRLSLHSSGIWRWAFIESSATARQMRGDRAQRKWLRPHQSSSPAGSQARPSCFPSPPSMGWEADPPETDKPVSWLEPPTKNEKVTVSLMIGAPGFTPARDLLEEKRFPLLAELFLRSGGRVWVAAKRSRMSFEEILGVATFQAQGIDRDVAGPGAVRIQVSESHGAPLFVEMRVPKKE